MHPIITVGRKYHDRNKHGGKDNDIPASWRVAKTSFEEVAFQKFPESVSPECTTESPEEHSVTSY